MPEDPAAQTPRPDDAPPGAAQVDPADPAVADPDGGLVVLLTEEALDEGDAERIAALHEAQGVRARYRVLVPADTERNLLSDVINHLSLFELREALDAVRDGQPDPTEARAEAGETLRRSVEVLRGAGCGADGEVVADDPLPALEAAVRGGGVREVVVVTRPRAVEDTFHRDWASRARDVLGVPVLHVYAGTARLG